MPLASKPLKLFAEIINCYQPDCQIISFNLPHLGIIEIKGKDASKFLQGQCTINTQIIAANTAPITAICNIQGRVMSLFHLIKNNDDFYLIMSKELIAPTLHLLKKYAVFAKITITDVTDTYHLHGIFANDDFTNQSISHDHYRINTALFYDLSQTPLENSQSSTLWHALMLYYQQPSLYEKGIGKWLPYELGLLSLQGIDFEKGCYLGQEIIARMHYRSKRHFVIRLATIHCPSNPLYAEITDAHDKTVATVIDAVSLQNTRYLILLSIKDGIFQEPLFLSNGERYDIEFIDNQME